MSDKLKLSPAVREIGALNFDGNIIPHEWYRHLRTANDTPHTAAIIILSEIVYWYRPAVDKDERTGALIGYHDKFKADMLQRSYQSFVDQFGFTKGQVKAAIDYLRDQGLVRTEFRNIHVGDMPVNNVLYIEPIPDALAKITYPVLDKEQYPYGVGGSTHARQAARGTNTETPSETTPDINDVPGADAPSGLAATPPPVVASSTTSNVPRKEQPPAPFAHTVASREYFTQFHRCRWATLAQRDAFMACEREVGGDAMLAAVRWAAVKGVSDVGAICTAARTNRANGGKKPAMTAQGRAAPPPQKPPRTLDPFTGKVMED